MYSNVTSGINYMHVCTIYLYLGKGSGLDWLVKTTDSKLYSSNYNHDITHDSFHLSIDNWGTFLNHGQYYRIF